MHPGIPDIYQGTELVTRTLVDPDNRAPGRPRRPDHPARSARLGLAPADVSDEKPLVTSRARLRRAHPVVVRCRLRGAAGAGDDPPCLRPRPGGHSRRERRCRHSPRRGADLGQGRASSASPCPKGAGVTCSPRSPTTPAPAARACATPRPPAGRLVREREPGAGPAEPGRGRRGPAPTGGPWTSAPSTSPTTPSWPRCMPSSSPCADINARTSSTPAAAAIGVSCAISTPARPPTCGGSGRATRWREW